MFPFKKKLKENLKRINLSFQKLCKRIALIQTLLLKSGEIKLDGDVEIYG